MPRLPLKMVAFIRPVSVPGTSIMMNTVEPMEQRLVGGEKYVCPQPFYDTDTDRVVIGDREYPIHLVHYFERAPAAKSKPAPEPNFEQYTVGKREVHEPRRIQISVEDLRDLGPVPRKGGPKD